MAAADGEKRGEGGVAPWLISAWFLWTVLFISTFIGAFIIFRGDHGPWEGTDHVVLSVAICGIVASVLAWMSYEAPAFFRRRSPRLVKSPNARYFLTFLLSMFLAWHVCVLGQACAFMGLPLEIVTPVFFGATWLLFIFHFPTKTKIIRWADGSITPRTVDSVELRKTASVTMTAAGALRESFAVLKKRWAALLAAAGACMFPSAVIGFLLMQRLANQVAFDVVEGHPLAQWLATEHVHAVEAIEVTLGTFRLNGVLFECSVDTFAPSILCGVPPQNPVNGAIVDVSALGVKLAYPDASLAVRPACDRQITAKRLPHVEPSALM